ncbi:hypothetical protein PNP85_12390 [Halobacterium salinarum]|uniref:hypothetical protein n=1 Tax=Halobacterium salinarum TaxID=2242 RepID=UPI002556406E|nr:hypothetical protein [Halobacterium salinarum]MDL0140301.1 hypothetical protein [Halobacterium salinarum]
MDERDESTEDRESGSLDGMMQHLEEAKKLDKSKSATSGQSWSGLQREVRKHQNVAILSKNYSERLNELVEFDAITHRSSSILRSAEAAFDAHGQLPIYYRTGDTVTHTGIITNLITEPDSDSTEAEDFRKHISQNDTYSDHNDELDKTTYIVRQGMELDDPFPMTELRKVSDSEPIDAGFWRSPAYVFQREGDFSTE